MVTEFSVNGVFGNVYTHQAYIMCSIYNPSNNYTVNGNINIGTLFSQLLVSYETKSCTECGDLKKSKIFTIPLPNLNIAWKFNYLNFQQEVENYFSTKIFNCQVCASISSQLEYSLGPYLWIDTDDAYTKSRYASELFKVDAENFTTNVNTIPVKLIIKNETFISCGVVKYILSLSMGHYFAFCYRLDRMWTMKDDLNKNKKQVTQAQKKIKISGLFYVKCKNN